MSFDTEVFINEVEIRPVVWDSRCSEYSNRIEKRKAWEELCEKFIPDFSSKTTVEKNNAVWFEPTDMRKAGKVFQCRHWTSLGYVSPNLNELQVMAQASGLFYSLSQFEGMCNDDSIVNEASFLARSLVEHIGTAVITMGRLGILIVREGEADERLLQPVQPIPRIRSKVSVRYYPVPYSVVEQKIVNVSGAGDCLAAGMLESMLRGQSERECVSAGFVAAASSLQSSSAIPEYFPPINNHQQIEYTVIHS